MENSGCCYLIRKVHYRNQTLRLNSVIAENRYARNDLFVVESIRFESQPLTSQCNFSMLDERLFDITRPKVNSLNNSLSGSRS